MRKLLLPALISAASLSIATSALAGTVTTDGSDIIIKTKGGLEAKTADGKASFKLGGRVQLDYNGYDGVINKVAPGENGSDLFFRRARLEMGGTYKDWGYLMSYNLTESGSIDLLWTSYNGFGKLAELTFGQQKEDFGLEDTGSSKWITAIERSMPSNAFDTKNNVGVKLHGANKTFSYSLGAYKQDLDNSNDLDSALTGRFVVRPLYGKDRLLHLGVGATSRDGEFSKISSRLGVRGGEDGSAAQTVSAAYTGTPAPVADGQDVWNAELAGYLGPVHLMAEYFDGKISGMNSSPDIEANGYYVQLGWIVTGEHRRYNDEIAAFDKVKPVNPQGAWEIFARYDELDASDNQNVAVKMVGETGNTTTLGVNWYANDLVKVGLNYVHAKTDQPIGGEDSGDALVSRLQIAF